MRSGIVFIITFVAIFSAACATHTANNAAHHNVDHNATGHDHSAMKSSRSAAAAPYDLQFIDTMIAHHQGALQMAELCAARAQHAEIKTLCANVIREQQKEIDDMYAWRQRWFKDAASALNMELAGMGDSMKDMDMRRLGALKGVAFDLEFISQMIPHHEGAVVMARDALIKSQKDEIKTLAGDVIKAQEAEVKQMREWQTAWSK